MAEQQGRLWRPWGPPCAFGETGEYWTGPDHCAACHEAVNAGCREFDAMVARGVYDDQGYTPAEARRARQAGTYRAWR